MSFLGRKIIFTLAAHLQFVQAWASHPFFAEKTTGLKQIPAAVDYTPRNCQTSGNENGFHIQPVGFGPVRAHGCKTCVNPARQHKTAIRLDGVFVECLEGEGWGILNALITVRQFMPLSWHVSSWSMLGMCFHRKCQAVWMEQMLARMESSVHSALNHKCPCSLSLTFLINGITM